MKFKTLFAIIGLIILAAGGWLLLKPGATTVVSAPNTTKVFAITVVGGKIVSGSGDITVNQGDIVNLTVTNDKDEEVHLHGYNKMMDVTAGQPSTLVFTADASGRFPFELENEKIELGAISVMPR